MEYSMEEMKEKMTIIFNKRTGDIKLALGGIQSIDTLYGSEAEDFKLIFGELVTERLTFVIDNPQQFIVDIEELRVVLREGSPLISMFEAITKQGNS